MKKICFDLDGVICTTKNANYKKSQPKKEIINLINKLYKKYYILIFTARYMGRSKENIRLAKKKGYKFTFKQLQNWNLKFHELKFGKPSYDIIVDDKSFGFKKNWHKKFKKIIK
tara:strand:- start:59 stop:400 length:342 start_codon:yes stop_codon:yes gene_type:complete